MAGWLHGGCVGVHWFSLPRCGFSLSLFRNCAWHPWRQDRAKTGSAPPPTPSPLCMRATSLSRVDPHSQRVHACR